MVIPTCLRRRSAITGTWAAIERSPGVVDVAGPGPAVLHVAGREVDPVADGAGSVPATIVPSGRAM